MFAPGQVEDLLRSHQGDYCSIQLFKELDGSGWSAAVNHYDPSKVSAAETVVRAHIDPVIALGQALVEDERLIKDVVRRYAVAPKAGGAEQQIDIEDLFAAACDDDLMGLLG